jgi:tetratricopeptide (TPR) repeat protein
MCASTESPFGDGDKQTALRLLNDLANQVESAPKLVAEQTAVLMPVLRQHFCDPAYGWALGLRAQACRFLDDLPGVLEAATAGIATFGDESRFAAQLRLEAGMSLNQFDRQSEALEHLQRAAGAFGRLEDEVGEGWALVSIAEALAGVGYPEDPLPYLASAIGKAERHRDDRLGRRAYKQRAVALRHRGRVDDALEAIAIALEDQPPGHTRANFQLERGHLLAMTGQYAAADEDYVAAESVYAETGDILGSANCARALATNALILGRNREGLRHLDIAAHGYRESANDTGLAYTVRERALVRLADGDQAGAEADATDATELFRRSGDRLGLAGTLRSAARIAHVRGKRRLADDLLAEAERLVADGTNPLAEAGILLMRAEIAAAPAQRLDAAQTASQLYEKMHVATGRAHALTFAARAHVDSGDIRAGLRTLSDAQAAWMRARTQVAEPGRRADHDLALRDIVTNALRIAADIGDPEGERHAADLVIADAPLGLRRALRTGELGAGAAKVMRRALGANAPARATPARRSLLQQLSFSLAALEDADPEDVLDFDRFSAAHPAAAVLALGHPTRDSEVPVAWAVPGNRPRFKLSALSVEHVDAIDELGRALTLERTDILWHPSACGWQHALTDPFMPPELTQWLDAHRPAELVVALPSTLAHVPLEALLVDGEPLGVLAAVRRVPVLTTTRVEPRAETVTAYLDPALAWSHERAACRAAAAEPVALRGSLGERRLVLAGCHGDSATRAEGTLTATDGSPVLDAIDLLSQSLRHSVVVLEACFSGRYLGARAGEQLNLATVALLAGASDVIAGLFALPAGDATTGEIAGHALRELQAGVEAPEALRRARAAYYSPFRARVSVPGRDAEMEGDAPWAWAGLCAYGR